MDSYHPRPETICLHQSHDGTFFHNLQIILPREDLEDYDAIVRLGNGSAIIVTGILLTPAARQPLEMKAIRVEVEGECPSDYPLQPKRHTPEFLRSIAHLRPRIGLLSAVFRVRSVASYAIHRFLMSGTSSTSIPRSSPAVMPRVPARCFP